MSGSVSDSEATITVNDVEVEVAFILVAQVLKRGSFSTDVELTEGENTITVIATLGEETVTKTVTVTYAPSE